MSALVVLLLLFIANGTPVIVRALLKDKFNVPVDGDARFIDGRPLLGPAKTVRGVLVAIAVTTITALLLGLPAQIGLIIGALAMAGDVVSSFIKRRLGIAPSGRALGLDQIPESLLPVLAVRTQLGLGWMETLWIVVGFVVIGLLMSRILFIAGVRRRPY